MAKRKMNSRLLEAVKNFLDLLCCYDNVGKKCYFKLNREFRSLWNRDDYDFYVARKYIHVIAPYCNLVLVVENGEMYYSKGRGMPNYNKPVGNIFKMLNKSDWGKTIKRKFSSRRQGMGYPGESAQIEEHDLSYRPEGHKNCNVCGRNNNVRKTKDGYYCQYCRTSASRHMNDVRRLGGIPSVDGMPIYSNEDFLVD